MTSSGTLAIVMTYSQLSHVSVPAHRLLYPLQTWHSHAMETFKVTQATNGSKKASQQKDLIRVASTAVI